MPDLRKSFCEVLGLWSLAHIKGVLHKNLTAELVAPFGQEVGVRCDTSAGNLDNLFVNINAFDLET